METGTPKVSRIVTMVLFALSCVGLLLFLWLEFGGTIPFNPQGYRFKVSFPYADQLATQADVRIAGVSVGKVIDKSLDPSGNRTIATIQMNNQYAPIHKNATAILRMKTILGETYVELTPGTPNAGTVCDGCLLARGQVQPAVQLSQIFDAFDPTTRHAFQQWQQELSQAIQGNDQNLNNVLGNLPTFVADATDITRVLDVEHTAVVNLLQNGGTVFNALDRSQSALRNVIVSGDSTFSELAANANSIAAIFHVFPTFLTESRLTMARVKSFDLNADPVLKELIPVANDLGPTLQSVRTFSPYLRHLFEQLGPLIDVSKTGLPATADVLRALNHPGCAQHCLLGSLWPFLEQLNPILGWLSQHQQLISDFISNGAGAVAARTLSFGGNGIGHYLRQFGPTGAETLGIATSRDSANRGNTYPAPLWLAAAFPGLNGKPINDWGFPEWDCKNTGSSANNGQVKSNPGTGPTHQGAYAACWVQGLSPLTRLPGQTNPYQIPHIGPAAYSNK